MMAHRFGEVPLFPGDICTCEFCEMLRNPPPPSAALKELFRKSREDQAGNPSGDEIEAVALYLLRGGAASGSFGFNHAGRHIRLTAAYVDDWGAQEGEKA